MKFKDFMEMLKSDKNLSREEANEFLGLILDEESIHENKIADALTALTNKDISVDEICGFIDAMKKRMINIEVSKGTIDTCGTGGDKSGTFNISTAAAILISAGGVTVAKHGNRAATSLCGSADVLEALYIPTNLSSNQATDFLNEHNFVFLFAPLFHPALKRLAIVRKKLGFPTIFNLLGPLLNPAGLNRQVIGTFSPDKALLIARVMSKMNYAHGIVLTSEDGLDEASLSSPVHIIEIRGQDIKEYTVEASDYGLQTAIKSELRGGDASENAKILTDALSPKNDLDPRQRIIVFNAAFGFYVSGKVESIEDGVEKAKEILINGKAKSKLKELQSR